MKIKFLTVITSLLAATFMITSCLDDNEDETVYSSNSSITAFSIENIETKYTAEVNGKDTTLTATVIGKNYPFVIDQGQRLIYNVDSLPVGTDVKKVVVNITADTPGIVIVAEDKDTAWVSTDSLNFEKPVKFKVMAYSGVFGPTYTASINVHKQVPDSLQWVQINSNFAGNEVNEQKAVTMDDLIYVFTRQDTKVAITTTNINDGRNWTPLQTIDVDNADYSSAMAWGSRLYILANNELYASTNGTEWSKVNTDAKFSKLIANVHTKDNQKLYAINTENHFMESEDGTTWKINEKVPSTFPQTHLSYAAYPLVTNTFIDRLTIMGDNSIATDTTTIVWTKLTTETNWADYPVTENGRHYCPKLENIAMIYYNKQLYAFGGPGKSYGKDIAAFSRFYQSKDQGVTWDPVSKYVFFPESFTDLYNQANGNYSYTIDKNNFLWIIWSKTGEVWRGRINKLGFDKKG